MKEPAIVLYTLAEAAEQLRVGKRWLRDFLRDHPFYRKAGRKIVLDADDIRSLHDAMKRPEPPILAKRQSRRSWRPSAPQPGWREVLARLQEGALKEKAEKKARRMEGQAQRRAERLKAKEPRAPARTGRETSGT